LALELDYFLVKTFEEAQNPQVESEKKIEEMKKELHKKRVTFP